MLVMMGSCRVQTSRSRASWDAEHCADSKLLQPGEEVVADFNGHGECRLLGASDAIDSLAL